MAPLPLITIGLKAFTCFWAFVTWIVAAAFIAKINDWAFGNVQYDAGNAVLAAGLLLWVYLLVALFFLFRKPNSILVSVMVDTIMFGFFFIFCLGATASLSSDASAFSGCSYDWCKLGSGVVGLGWVMTFLVLGILAFEVAYTLKNHGGALDTWKTPFNELLHYGSTSRGGTGISNTTSGPVQMGSVADKTTTTQPTGSAAV